MDDLDNLPDPDTLAEGIVENSEAGLESFKAIIASLNSKNERFGAYKFRGT
ncbi:hypothetical protein [Lacibacter sp.]|uniref:hypothetical protein n=1 Tax=Lacibacter sp. TaxID=1915409 RepID=UPI002B4B8F03|nr:hypothetical protein [Lacibacter sp.]HLP39505.1 hypothetical protein [Lacibacter sp.]